MSGPLFVAELEKLLECPVCFHVPQFIPINQCSKGHILCSACRASVTQCPLCREKLAMVRSLVAEQMLERHSKPCQFEKFGCKARLIPSNTEFHLGSCQFKKITCPVNNCRQVVDSR